MDAWGFGRELIVRDRSVYLPIARAKSGAPCWLYAPAAGSQNSRWVDLGLRGTSSCFVGFLVVPRGGVEPPTHGFPVGFYALCINALAIKKLSTLSLAVGDYAPRLPCFQ